MSGFLEYVFLGHFLAQDLSPLLYISYSKKWGLIFPEANLLTSITN